MQNSIKGALAAITGGALLLGGAGSLAYWSDESTIGGADIESGTLALSAPSCAGWKLDGDTAFAAQKLVPGDVLTQVCTFTVTAEGAHLAATFDVSTPTWDEADALTGELDVDAAYRIDAEPVTAFPAAVANEDVVTATVTVAFDGAAATNASRSISSALDDITITATQSHAS